MYFRSFVKCPTLSGYPLDFMFFSALREKLCFNSRWIFCLLLLNTVLLCLIALPYVSWMDIPEGSWLSYPYIFSTQVGLFGLMAVLCAIPSLLLLWLPTRLFRFIAVLPFIVTAVMVAIDTQVYNQYRFHLNGFVFELLIEGGDQIIDVSWFTLLVGGVVVFGLINAIIMTIVLANRWVKTKKRYFLLGISVWFSCLLFSQLTHAWKYANFDQVIPSYSHHWPLYLPLTANDWLEDNGWVEQQAGRDAHTKISHQKVTNLNYPLKPIAVEAGSETPNMVVIVLDAWRFDDANEQVTPNIETFGKQSLVFKEHLSGGNSTQMGIFSLFYGIPSTYWDAVRSSQQQPVLMETLHSLNYQMSIHGSAPLHSPPFDRTVFAGIKDLTVTTPGDTPAERDRKITDDFLEFLDSKDDTKPYFGFLFYDAAHGTSFPNDMKTPFEPYWDRVDHVKLNNDFDPTEYRNRYRNSLFYIDKLVGEVLGKLEQAGELDNTIVVITSDHGEEFNDYKKNYWGHGSNYAPAQVHVPLYLYHPGKAADIIYARTSHLDIPPTLMKEPLGVSNDISDYSVGVDLFNNNREENWVIVGSYMDYGIVGGNEIIVNRPGGYTEVTDLSLNKKEKRTMPNSELTKLLVQMSTYAK
ncbi:DUF3413 domain-containing protein [Vibrio nigripulchritudo]|uniref:DUF3413 domain-containing protein n=1 Tax=Vibrio nigripulchritudo TaxID=28173 RepID=UPI001EF6E098|nr:DUF3413 domain-containing protein [Vibrio nigripulchritudo]